MYIRGGMNMLSVKNLTRKYKNGDSYIKAVNNITRDFKDGEMVFVLGASGSGKSTLLNVLCGLDTEIEGSVIVDGVDTSEFTKKDWAVYRNYYVGFIFQEYNLIEHLKIWENVALPLMFQGVSKSKAKEAALEQLDKVGLSSFVNKFPKTMSGGQNQRVAIARALVTNPKVIMADEPTGALDTELGNKVVEYIKKVASDKVVVVVTHDEDLANAYATRIVRLEDGIVIDDTNIQDVTYVESKKLDFKRPKMGLRMILKFALNNVTSRMMRSILTSTIVAIGYVSIFLLTFLIMGINSSISEAVGGLVPEDQYQIFPVENIDIEESLLADINAMDIVEDARYSVFVNSSFMYRNEEIFVIGTSVPYDTSLLNQSGTMLGRLPENDNEIIVSSVVAARMRGLTSIDNDSFELVFALLENEEVELENSYFDEVDGYVTTEIGTYEIVGMTIDPMSNLIYLNYEETIAIHDIVAPDSSYQGAAIAYLNTTNEDEIDVFKQTVRDDYDLVVENYFESITGSVEDFMFNALKVLIAVASITLIVSGILIGLVVYTSIKERI